MLHTLLIRPGITPEPHPILQITHIESQLIVQWPTVNLRVRLALEPFEITQ